jgi:hypothetical protein
MFCHGLHEPAPLACVYCFCPGSIEDLTATCQTALTQTIKCHSKFRAWQQPATRRSLHNVTLTDEVCDVGCGNSLRTYYEAVTAACQGQNFTVPAGVTFPERAGGTIWTGYNETCLKDPTTDEYCSGRYLVSPLCSWAVLKRKFKVNSISVNRYYQYLYDRRHVRGHAPRRAVLPLLHQLASDDAGLAVLCLPRPTTV